MGSRTYEHALELSKSYGWGYGEVQTIVVSRRNLPIERQSVKLYSGDLNALVSEKLKPNYQNVWIVGGAKLAKEFINLKLADEIRFSVLPIILGDGLLFSIRSHRNKLCTLSTLRLTKAEWWNCITKSENKEVLSVALIEVSANI